MVNPGEGGLILFACDHPEAAPQVAAVANELGHGVVHADSPNAALAQVRAREFALILVGFPLAPDALLHTIRLLRGDPRASHTPLVALLPPDARCDDPEQLYEAGAVAVLHRPVSAGALRAKTRFYLDAFANAAERRRVEADLVDTRARLETIIDAAELAVWTWDADQDLVSADHRMAALFGIAPEAAGSCPIATYFAALHPDDVRPSERRITDALASGQAYEASFRVRRPEGGWRWLIARGQRVQDAPGAPSRLRGVVIDATRQFEAEQQLRASEERYRTVFESIDEGLCVVEILHDASGNVCDYRFLEANPAFARHTGLRDSVGKTLRELAAGHEEDWFQVFGRVAASGAPLRFVTEAKALGRWYDVYATRIGPAESGRVALLFNDISERRHTEEELRRLASDLAEANRLKTEFLATLAHELRNPLAPIRSGLQFLRRSHADPVALARIQDIMDRQLDHLVNLVDDLLDVARITRGQVELKREWIDLGTILSAAVETSTPLIEASRHHLGVRLPQQPLPVYADATRLTQVVSNLLNNAAKYTPRGGSIMLAAEQDGEHAVIAVSDNGIGIAPDALDDVFKMFTQVGQRNQGGLGIGLSLVRSLVELHGGSVRAASAGVNAGSVFTVRLPLSGPEAAPAPPAQAAPEADGAALRVLVVDDNRDAAETLSALLGLMGHTAPVANDGHQALRMLPTFQPQVVFLDLGMPGLSGYEVARAIRKDPRYDGITLVALTGWGGQADRARSAAAGFDLHLTKPATTAAIEDALARR